MKFIVAVVLAIFAVQLVQSASLEERKSATEKLEDAIQTARDAIELARVKTKEGIQEGIDEVEKAFNTAEKAVHGALTEAMDEILKLEEEAHAQGVETVECTHAQRETLNDLRDKTVSDLDQVGKNTTDVLERVQTDVNALLQELLNVADDILEKFKACKSILCQTKILVWAIPELIDITVKVPGIVAKSLADAATTTANGIKSVNSLAADYLLTTKDMMKEIRQCIKDKVEAA